MSSGFSLALLLCLALQVILVALFSWLVRKRRIEQLGWKSLQIGDWPPAEVILCLRGADENLGNTLESLARQQYMGEWRFLIVIDCY